jgi:flagellar capping protein FliD
MTSACKKLENKKSFIKLLDREGKGSHEDKLKTVSTDKEKKRSGGASASKTKRNKDEMKDLLKESYMFVKEENESLVNKLRRKMRKIEEMKEVIAKLEHTVREYEEMMGMMKHDRATAKTKSGEESLRGSRKYE